MQLYNATNDHDTAIMQYCLENNEDIFQIAEQIATDVDAGKLPVAMLWMSYGCVIELRYLKTDQREFGRADLVIQIRNTRQ